MELIGATDPGQLWKAMGMRRKEMPTVIWSPQGGTQVAVRPDPILVGGLGGGHYADPYHHSRD